MRSGREIFVYLLFVAFAVGLWIVNAANKRWQHVAITEQTETAEITEPQTDDMTEKKMTVAVELIGVPQDKVLRVFPCKVTIFVRVRVSEYKDVTPDMVRVWCSYPTTHQDALRLHIDTQDERIHSVRVQPEEVEYLIEN